MVFLFQKTGTYRYLFLAVGSSEFFFPMQKIARAYNFLRISKRFFIEEYHLLHFVAFFHVASLFVSQVENRKVGVDNRKVK